MQGSPDSWKHFTGKQQLARTFSNSGYRPIVAMTSASAALPVNQEKAHTNKEQQLECSAIPSESPQSIFCQWRLQSVRNGPCEWNAWQIGFTLYHHTPFKRQHPQCLQTAVSHKSRSGCKLLFRRFHWNNTSLQRPEPKHPSKDRRQHTTSQTTSHPLYSPSCLQQATTAKRWGFNSLPPSQHRSCTAKPRQRRKSAAQCKVTKTARDVQKAHCNQKTACYSWPLPTEKKKWRQKKKKTSQTKQVCITKQATVGPCLFRCSTKTLLKPE